MSSSIDTIRIRVESVLLALGILGFIQLSMMSDDDPCTWICWARLATACGVMALVLGAVACFNDSLRGAPSGLNPGLNPGSETPAPGFETRNASGSPTSIHTQAGFEKSLQP